MLRAKQLFDSGIIRIRNVDSIYLHLIANQGFIRDDVSDLLRSEIVYVISSFDRLIHDLVRIGMRQTYNGLRSKTNSYKNYSFTINETDRINYATIPPSEYIFEEIIASKHKHLSFQEPEKINEALSLIWLETHKWQVIANRMGRNQNDLKTELKNIILRRNQIVHEGDFDLSTGNLQPITHNDTVRSVNFIESLGNTIYDIIS
ncbi:HEPN domain-containing protein [uncultured Psychroserpens sp.]|uniref:HEPN domain-containing protein n=1 Tax=uncultured Psychroserpens sp. TaxID=255436 RepID=UPI00260FDDD7|nr:HEPN domain-containing protein [uncultured Psychroserpens sp.]